MAELAMHLSDTSVQSWMCRSSVCVAGPSSISSFCPDPGGMNIERQRQLWEDLFSDSSQWWDNRLDKRTPRQPDFRHKLTREPLWLSHQSKPVWVDSRLNTLDVHVQPRGSRPAGPSHEFESACQAGQLDKAIDVVVRLDLHGTVASVSMCRSVLKACGKARALAQAKRVQAYVKEHGLESVLSLGEYLVSTLVKCGSLEDGLEVFYMLRKRSAFSWTAVICGYTATGQGRMALVMYDGMQEEGVVPDKYTFVSLLKACGSLSDLQEGKRIHGEVLKYGHESDLLVATCLLDMYAKCGSMVDAQNVFEGLVKRDVVAWNAMLTAYAQVGLAEKVLELYELMQEEGVNPDNRTFVSTLQACGMLAEKDPNVVVMDGLPVKLESLNKGRAVHAHAWKNGFDSDAYVGAKLVSLYGKCGSIVNAEVVFAGLSRSNVGSWNAIFVVYAQHHEAWMILQLYEQMRVESVTPDDRTFVCVLKACCMLAEHADAANLQATLARSLEQGRVIHAEAWRNGYDSDVFVGSTLVSLYGMSGSTVDAQIAFNGLSKQNVVSWTALLAAYVQQGLPGNALQLYEQMQEEGVSPDDRTFVIVLQACGMLAEREDETLVRGACVKVKFLEKGKVVHAYTWRKGYSSDAFVANTLLSMYGKCGSVEDATDVFTRLSLCTALTWTAMISAYSQQGQADKIMHLYVQMRQDCVSPDDWTYVSVLQACGMLADKEGDVDVNGLSRKWKSLQVGKAIHADTRVRGYALDGFVGNALVRVYGKCGSIEDVWNVFDSLSDRDVISWNVLFAAYAQQGQGDKILHLYRQMQQEGTRPDEITLACILQVCSNTGSLDLCRQIHRSLVSTGMLLNPLLTSCLVHAYGRCASMVDACTVFYTLPKPDAVAWTTLMAGYARQGDSSATLRCYDEMQQAGVKPDGVTFLALLSACCHAGLLNKGLEYFASMSRDYGITPQIEHYASMIDLLGRAGHFTEVEQLMVAIPMPPDSALWLCLLGSCQKHGQVDLGKQAFDSAVSLQPSHSAAYVLMYNIYADAGLWDCANEVKQLRVEACAWKQEASQSWIEHAQKLYTFVAECPEQQQLHDLLSYIGSKRLQSSHEHAWQKE